MKIIANALLFLFIAFNAYAGGGAVSMMVASGVATTSSTTLYCTGADPICEDMEGATSCYAAYDSNCDLTWDALGTTGGTIDFTTTAPGTYPCSGTTNTNVLSMVKDNTGSTNMYVYEGFAAANEIWVKAWIRFGVIPAPSGSTSAGVPFTLYTGSINAITMYLQTTAGGQGQLYARYNSTDVPAYVNGSTVNISVDTWYKITLRWKASTGASDGIVYFKLDSTEVTNVTNNNSTATISRLYIGHSANDADVWTMYLDNLAVDNDTEPSDCP